MARGWCLALRQLVPGLLAGAASTDPAGPGHAALQAKLSVQPCRQHGEVGQEDELVVVLGTRSTWESPRLGSWGQAGQEQAVMVVCVIARSMCAQGWCVEVHIGACT